MIFNGIHRADVKVDRSKGLLDVTNGALNERFCYGQDSTKGWEYGLLPKELQLEDINLQLSIGKNKQYVLQKVNWEGMHSQLSQNQRDIYGNYCYGIFLMGHVPGYTFFKFGSGYNLTREPSEYHTQAPATKIDLGKPLTNYQNNDGLLTRKFEKSYVVVNLNKSPKNWINPESNESITIPSQQARFYKIDSGIATTTPSSSPVSGISTTCRMYCRNKLNYNNGWCAKKSENCAINNGDHHPEADGLCAPELSCCCRN